MTELAEVHEDWRDETPVGRVEGEVDASNATMVGIRLRALVANRAFGLVVDLTATTYIDSAGINMLFVLGDELRARQQRLRLVVGPTTPIARMLSITGLDRTYPAHATVDEALAA
jgi:anti-sigma B factor antagonist